MNTQRKQTITKSLCDGINAARKHSSELREELLHAPIDSTAYNDIEAQIETYDDWVVELADALHWLDGAEQEEMEHFHNDEELKELRDDLHPIKIRTFDDMLKGGK